MLKWLIVVVALALMFASCKKELKPDSTLNIVANAMGFSSGGANGEEEYFYPSDSTTLRDDVVEQLTNDFDGSNNLKVVNNWGQYTLQITQCHFSEWITYRTIADPCDSSIYPDSLHFTLHNLDVSMNCILYDHARNTYVEIQANASDEEDLKDGPSFLQSLFNSDCDCYEPRVKAIYFYNKLRKRVFRRIHRRAIDLIYSWQG